GVGCAGMSISAPASGIAYIDMNLTDYNGATITPWLQGFRQGSRLRLTQIGNPAVWGDYQINVVGIGASYASLQVTPLAGSSTFFGTNPADVQVSYIPVGASGTPLLANYATTGPLDPYTVQAFPMTLYSNANGFLTPDGVISVNAGDLVLVKNEVGGNAKNNGLYTVNTPGSSTTHWQLD